MNILIADDHELICDTICAYIERESDITVAHAADMFEAAKKIYSEGPFDLVLLDYTMPGMNGLDGLTKALRLNAGRPVALISGTATRTIAEAALAAGAAGFLPKTISARSLIHAVRFMVAGEKYIPVEFMTERAHDMENPLAKKLTPREFDVLRGLILGQSNKEIAKNLHLQEVTIKLHVKTLSRKLNARNRTHAAMIAREAGLG